MCSGEMFEVEAADWTKELRLFVEKGWGREGVFQVRNLRATWKGSNRWVVVLFFPVYITRFEERINNSITCCRTPSFSAAHEKSIGCEMLYP